MKKIIAITALACGLVACGSKTVYVVDTLPGEDTTDTEAPETTVKKTTTTTEVVITQPPVTWTAEDEFLFDVKNSVGYVGVSDYDLIETGYIVCDALRSGATIYDLADAISSIGYQQEFLAAVSASAALNLCPDQAWKFAA